MADFTVDVREAGEEYNKKIEVDQNEGTELSEIPAHPGVYRRDPLYDLKPVSFSSLLSTPIFKTVYYMYICADGFKRVSLNAARLVT